MRARSYRQTVLRIALSAQANRKRRRLTSDVLAAGLGFTWLCGKANRKWMLLHCDNRPQWCAADVVAKCALQVDISNKKHSRLTDPKSPSTLRIHPCGRRPARHDARARHCVTSRCATAGWRLPRNHGWRAFGRCHRHAAST